MTNQISYISRTFLRNYTEWNYTCEQTDKALYVRKSAMSVGEFGQEFCLAESTDRQRLEMWCKRIAFMGIIAANRTGTLCVPVIDYILACDLAVADSIQNNFNRSS